MPQKDIHPRGAGTPRRVQPRRDIVQVGSGELIRLLCRVDVIGTQGWTVRTLGLLGCRDYWNVGTVGMLRLLGCWDCQDVGNVGMLGLSGH